MLALCPGTPKVWKVQRHRLQHPLLEPLKYKLASLVFDHGLFLQHFFILHFDFPWLLPRQRLSRTPSQPIPSCPIPWFFILAFSLFIFQIRPWLLLPLLFPTGFCGLFESSSVCLMSAHEISPRWHFLAPVFPALTALVFF